MSCRRWLYLCGIVLALALPYRAQADAAMTAPLPRGAQGWTKTGARAMRGVTVGPIESSREPGRGYGTAFSEALLEHLKTIGVNWIAVTPYGRMWTDKSQSITMDFEAPYEDNRRAMKRMVEQAHAHNIRVFMVPHLWLEAGGDRRTIDPGSPHRWAAFLLSYHDFIVAWAKDAGDWGVDMFAIGQECQTFSGRFYPFWQRLIREVRRVFPGLVTYSANWYLETVDVLFWDLLDLVGINAFYELAWDKDSAYENAIKAEEALTELKSLALQIDKPVIFTEIGYTNRKGALRQPWRWPEHSEQVTLDDEAQVRGFKAMLSAFIREPWFAGLFVWRYYANLNDVSQEPHWGFSPYGKPSEDFLKSTFRQWWAADPSPWPWQRMEQPDP